MERERAHSLMIYQNECLTFLFSPPHNAFPSLTSTRGRKGGEEEEKKEEEKKEEEKEEEKEGE